MFRNLFVTYFKFLDIKLLRILGIPKLLAKKLDLMTHGISLERGNLYCYRTSRYSLITAMAQNVNYCGAQAHIWTANIAPDLTLYTTHPARDDDSRDKHGASPGYWVGNGRQPMSVQDKNVNITIYKIPKKKRLAEFHIANVTHAYVPREKYDKLEFEGNYMFGQRKEVLVALITSAKPEYRPYDAYAASLLIQHDRLVEKIGEINLNKEFDLVLKDGEYHCYVTELSDTDKETYEDFKKRIKSNKLDINCGSVVYCSGGRELIVSYGGAFMVNGENQSLDYPRYDSSYVKAEKKPEEINISYNGKSLKLNYKRMERIENA
jgi:hypothetical protein